MKTTIAEFVLRQPSDAAELAQRAKVVAAMTQLSPQRRNELAEAVNMVCRTTAAHGGKGKVRFSLVQRGGQRAIEVSVSDLGPNAPEAGKKASHGESTPPKQDPWETAVMQRVGELVDHFESSGWPVAGVIRMAQTLPPAFAFPSESECADWAQMLQSNTALDALAYALQRARSLEQDLCQQQLRSELGNKLSESDHLAILSLVIGKTKNAISILQPDGTIVSVNDAFVRMTGYGASEAAGQPLHDLLLGPSSDAAAVAAYRQALAQGEELTQDILQYRKDGQIYWVESDLIPVLNAQDKLAQWIVIATDITRRRETEEALRTAKETAEKNNRLKSEFLANMSHEIRTPLNAVIGMTDLALATEMTQQQQQYLQTVRNSGETLLNLLNDILDLSKIEAGKMVLEEIDFDLRQIVEDSVGTLAVQAAEKGLTLTTHLAADLPRSVRGDPTKLRQVLINLIGNAIKFTQTGVVSVTAELQWHSDDEVALHFAVRDTGIGIEPEKLNEVFQAFRQADASTTRQFGGSGLGLTITSELVRMMRGRIWVDSNPGEGSEFHFAVLLGQGAPLALPPATDGQTGPIPSHQNGKTSPIDWDSAPRVRSLNVLLADDHTANRQLVTSVLQRRGHQCTEATNGQEAVRAWQEGTFDVLLMDVQMPIMDGFQATAEIRKLEESGGGHLPIIALTAHAMAGDREKCLAAGMDAYMAKPLRPQQLVEMVESLADLRTQEWAVDANAPAPCDTTPEFNLDYALQSLDNDRDLLVGQMEFFLQDSPVLLAHMDQAINDQDAYQLRLSAHRLKGMLARYAYHRAAEFALQLESKGKQGQLEDAQQLVDQLRPMVSDLATAIREFM